VDSMNPEVSNVVGTLITELGFTGSVKDQLQRAGERAQSIADLPQWAQRVWFAHEKASKGK